MASHHYVSNPLSGWTGVSSDSRQIELDPEVTVGSFVAVLDSSDNTRYHMIDITDQNMMVHYYDTKIRQLRGAK